MRFNKLRAYLEQLPVAAGVPACGLLVNIGRETVFSQTVNAPAEGLYWLYSATKLFTAVMYGRMLERGLLRGSDRVSDYLPEYRELTIRTGDEGLRPAAAPLTLDHLITMCGGLTYDIGSPEITAAKDRSTRGIVREIARMPLAAQPGETYLYSLCHDVLAAVMETVAEKRYADLLRDEICLPLGMTDTGFHPTEDQQRRLQPQYSWKGRAVGAVLCPAENRFRFSGRYDSGGAGLFSSLRDYSLLIEALACGGLGRNGYPLLQPETVEAMRKDRLSQAQKQGFYSRWEGLGSYSYGLGVRTRLDQRDGSRFPAGEFGWDGAAGAYCLVEPGGKLSAFYVQHVLDMGYVFAHIHPTLRELIGEAVGY